MEEEDNVSKRCNMADSVGEVPTVAATQPELSLTDIKELLVDIQITVATIHRENQALKQEILELKSALNANQRETEKLKTQLTKAEKGNETLTDELNHTRIKLKYQTEEMNDWMKNMTTWNNTRVKIRWKFLAYLKGRTHQLTKLLSELEKP